MAKYIKDNLNINELETLVTGVAKMLKSYPRLNAQQIKTAFIYQLSVMFTWGTIRQFSLPLKELIEIYNTYSTSCNIKRDLNYTLINNYIHKTPHIKKWKTKINNPNPL